MSKIMRYIIFQQPQSVRNILFSNFDISLCSINPCRTNAVDKYILSCEIVNEEPRNERHWVYCGKRPNLQPTTYSFNEPHITTLSASITFVHACACAEHRPHLSSNIKFLNHPQFDVKPKSYLQMFFRVSVYLFIELVGLGTRDFQCI